MLAAIVANARRGRFVLTRAAADSGVFGGDNMPLQECTKQIISQIKANTCTEVKLNCKRTMMFCRFLVRTFWVF